VGAETRAVLVALLAVVLRATSAILLSLAVAFAITAGGIEGTEQAPDRALVIGPAEVVLNRYPVAVARALPAALALAGRLSLSLAVPLAVLSGRAGGRGLSRTLAVFPRTGGIGAALLRWSQQADQEPQTHDPELTCPAHPAPRGFFVATLVPPNRHGRTIGIKHLP
jgi:hypothetical protein